MRWVLVTLGLIAVLGVGAVLAVPTVVAQMADDRGVRIGRASWCGTDLCFTNIARGPIVAMSGRVGSDRVLTLNEVVVKAGGGAATPGGAAAPDAEAPDGGVPDDAAPTAAAGETRSGPASAGGFPALEADELAPLVAVRVEGLTVEGLPLPSLSGEVWPERRLEGEGVSIDGDTVEAAFDTEHGRVEAKVTREGAALVGEARCDCSVEAFEGAKLRGAVQAEGRYEGGRFVGTVGVDELRADVEATRDDQGVIRASFTLVDQPIAGVYQLFGAVVPEADSADIRGTVSATGTVRWPDVDLVVKPRLTGFAVDGLVSPAYTVGAYAYPVLTRDGAASSRTTGPGDPSWLGLAGMGPVLPAAVIAAEDARFRLHPGYDIDGMLDAARANRVAKKIERGGSTLTQQLAKNLFLDGSRTYGRKLRELLYAVELERELGKLRILETYLNVVEFGPGVYGARAGTTAFFSKSPSGLLPEEAAFLAAILKYPRTAWKTQYQRGTAHRTRVDKILENMRDLPPEERAAAKAREIVLVPGG